MWHYQNRLVECLCFPISVFVYAKRHAVFQERVRKPYVTWVCGLDKPWTCFVGLQYGMNYELKECSRVLSLYGQDEDHVKLELEVKHQKRGEWEDNRKRTCNAAEELTSKLLDMPSWERLEVIFLEEIVHTHPIELRDQTNMITMVKPMQ